MRAIVYNVTRAVRIAEPTGIEINVELFTRPTWRVRGGKTSSASGRVAPFEMRARARARVT